MMYPLWCDNIKSKQRSAVVFVKPKQLKIPSEPMAPKEFSIALASQKRLLEIRWSFVT